MHCCPSCRSIPVIADKGYDAQQRGIEPLLAVGKQSRGDSITPHQQAPNKRQSGYDAVLYMARHVIENCFAKLKQYRAIATRYDKTASNFLGAIHLAAAVIWMVW